MLGQLYILWDVSADEKKMRFLESFRKCSESDKMSILGSYYVI